MKRFEFELESLLNYKGHLEQVAQREMARAQAAFTDCEQRILDLNGERHTWVMHLDTRVLQGITAAEFQGLQGFIQALAQSIETETHNKAALKKRLDEKRNLLTQRTIEKKALTRLREKRFQDYLQEMRREEQKALDEICAVKTAREALNDHA